MSDFVTIYPTAITCADTQTFVYLFYFTINGIQSVTNEATKKFK